MESRLRQLVPAILLLALVGVLILVNRGPHPSSGPARPEEAERATSPDGPAVPDPGEGEGGIVEGRVERRGRGVAARVEVRVTDRFDRHPVAGAADAGPAGRFRIEGLPPGR
jgi:hypothetical protein